MRRVTLFYLILSVITVYNLYIIWVSVYYIYYFPLFHSSPNLGTKSVKQIPVSQEESNRLWRNSSGGRMPRLSGKKRFTRMQESKQINPKYITFSAELSKTTSGNIPIQSSFQTSTLASRFTSRSLSTKPIPREFTEPISCAALFKNDQSELKRSFKYLELFPKISRADNEYSSVDCSDLLSKDRYVLWPTSQEESEFPLAFAIVMYRDVEQFERLLRSIYRPQNIICVHVDLKSPDTVWKAVNHIAGCLNNRFNNVIITKSRVHPEWGQYSVLEADLNCIRELHSARDRRKWRYFINLTGQEFPLRTHLELVRILSILNGANLMEAQPSASRDRLRSTEKIPSGVHMYKGSIHIVVSAAWVDFALNNPRAIQLLSYVRDHTDIPDEWYFSTLNHNPYSLPAPGSFIALPNGTFAQTDTPTRDLTIANANYPFLNRIKVWVFGEHPCSSGNHRNALCIFGHGDLPYLSTRRELFINKLIWNQQPFALDCLEQWFWNRTIEDFVAGPYSPLALTTLAVPANLTGIWPLEIASSSTGQSEPAAAARRSAPSRIDLDFWRALKVVKQQL